MSKNSVSSKPEGNKWVIVLLSLIVGFMIGFLVYAPKTQFIKQLETVPLRNIDPEYPLVDRFLGFDNAEATNFGELVSFKKKLSDLVNAEINQNNALQISIYFRDFNIGRWISVNEDETYSPASLLKVPVMMTYYSLSRNNPELLSQQITFTGKNDIDSEQITQPSQKLVSGTSYTIEDLIRRMIVYSDNDAMQLLINNIDSNAYNQIYSKLGVLFPTNIGAQDFISVKEYAIFFRVLYGATYLSLSNSEKALDLLTKTEFKGGIVAGVPEGMVVAHKFGERGFYDPTNPTQTISTYEFHDCGIIYNPNDPYLLCVMTKGADLNKLENSVSDISKLVYSDEIQNKDN